MTAPSLLFREIRIALPAQTSKKPQPLPNTATRRRVAAVMLVSSALLILTTASVTGNASAAPAADQTMLTADQVLARIHMSMRLPDNMTCRQEGQATGIFGRFQWSARLERVNGYSSAKAVGLPSWVPEELLSDLADFEKAVEGFRLEYKGTTTENGLPEILIDGVRKPGISTGAIDGQLWADSTNFRINRMEARYLWGKLKVAYTYHTIDGAMVLAKQEATISPLSMRMVITYHDYSIGRSHSSAGVK